MGNVPERPIASSYWVIPGALLAGEYPGAYKEVAMRLKLRRLLQAGITFFLDLTTDDDGLVPYDRYLQEEAAVLGRKARHRRSPVRDMRTPSPVQMIEILDTIDEAIAAGQTVYLHCWGGIGRTGTVVGCYLVRHGMSAGDALAVIARLRAPTPDASRPAPETAAQREMVLGWGIGD